MKMHAFLLSTALLAGCRSSTPDLAARLPSQAEADRRYLVDRLAAACDGRAYPEAAAYDAQPGSHPTAIVQRFDGGENKWRASASPYEPKRLADAQLVACIQRPSYGPMRLTVVSVRSGTPIAEREIPPPQFSGQEETTRAILEAVAPFAEGRTGG